MTHIPRRISRRTFIRDYGRGLLGIAIGGSILLPGCGDSSTADELTVHRVNLAIVSAYLLVRGSEVLVVDTGLRSSTATGKSGADEIEEVLAEVGLGWANVSTVILTHHHSDHVGALSLVANRATDAVVGTGAGDIDFIYGRLSVFDESIGDRDLVAFEDGQEVAGSTIISTPGHTPGHISVWDGHTRTLIAGDALNGIDNGSGVTTVDGVGGPSIRTEEMDLALESAHKLARLGPETIYFGHGSPKVGGAAKAVAALLADLQDE